MGAGLGSAYRNTSGLHTSASAARSSRSLGGLLSTRSTWAGFVVGHQALAPAGQQDDRRGRRRRLHRRGDLAAVDVRHAEIGDHDVEGSRRSLRGAERIDAGLAAAGRRSTTWPSASSTSPQRLQQQRIVVDHQQAQPPGAACVRRRGSPAARRVGAAPGRLSRTVVPRPGALSMSISAPWRCTMP